MRGSVLARLGAHQHGGLLDLLALVVLSLGDDWSGRPQIVPKFGVAERLLLHRLLHGQ